MNGVIVSGLLGLVEKALVAMEPEIQAEVLAALQKGLDALVAYINMKLATKKGA